MMRPRNRACSSAIALSLFGLILAGCSPTLTVKRSQTLAGAGTAYVQALEDLVRQDRDQYVDRDSSELLVRMNGEPAAARAAVEQHRREILQSSDQRLSPLLKKYDLLLQQLSLEQGYFQSLQALADDDANTAAADAAASAAGALNDINVALGKSKTPPISDDEKKALTGLAGQVGDFIKARALQHALRRDAVTISEALAWNDSIVADLAADLDANNQSLRKQAYAQSVIDPYVAGTASGDGWKDARRDYFTTSLDVETVDKAKAASQKLRIAWEAALHNKLDTETIQAALKDIQSLASSLDAIRKARKPADTK